MKDYIERQLAGDFRNVRFKGMPVSSRHDAWVSVSFQMGAEGHSEDEQFQRLNAWISDEDKPDAELRRIIRSSKGARNSQGEPGRPTTGIPVRNNGTPKRNSAPEKPKIKPSELTGDGLALPSNLANTTPAEFLRQLYRPNDFINVAFQFTDTDTIHTVREWELLYEQNPGAFEAADRIWFCINPLLDQTRRANDQVADFRYCLIEGDPRKDVAYTPEEKRRFKENQYAFLLASRLPIAAIYDSANKSIHVLVCIDAKSEAEFDERRVRKVYEYCANFPGLDTGRNASAQLSRLPGASRGGNRQALLSSGLGPASYEEWEVSIEPKLFEITDLSELVHEDPPLPPVLIDGWLDRGSIGMLTGSMRTNKSWTLLELAIAFAKALKWFDRECRQSTVLYFDAEINQEFWQKRFRIICDQRGLDPGEVARVGRIKPVFIAGKDVTIKGLHAELIKWHSKG